MQAGDRVKVNALAIKNGIRQRKSNVIGTIIKIVRHYAVVKWDSATKAHSNIHLDFLELA